MSGFQYAGKAYDFSYVVYEQTGEHVHELCGFALISAITGQYKTAQSSRSIIQPLKQFWEDVILFNGVDWRLLCDEQIVKYLYEYRYKKQGCEGSTIDLQRSAIEAFYRWAYLYGFIEYPMELDISYELDGFENYLNYRDKQKAIESQYISDADFKKLLANVPGKSRYIIARNEIALLLGKDSGVRTHELTSPYNFNVKNLLRCIEEATSKSNTGFNLTIYGKGNHKPRKIEITTKLFLKLKQFLKDKKLRGGYSLDLPLFLSADGREIISRDFGTKVFKQAKDAVEDFLGPAWNNKSYHSLRHSYATDLAAKCAEEGLDWRAVLPPKLGHAKWETSQIYVEVDALLNNRSDVLNKLKTNVRLRGSSV